VGTGEPHFITQGLPLDLLPEGNTGGSFYQYKAQGTVLIKSGEHPVLAVKNFGKGRVVAMAYVEEGFTPQSINPNETKIYWDYWEYQYSLLARSLLWAAGREAPVSIESIAASNSGLKLALSVASQRSVQIEVTGRNEFGQSLGSTRVDKSLAVDQTHCYTAVCFAIYDSWPGGRQIFNVIIRDSKDNSTLNWGAATFDTQSAR
jgi:hypothetical protein